MVLTSKNYVDTNLSDKRDLEDYTFNDNVVRIKQVDAVTDSSILWLTSDTKSLATEVNGSVVIDSTTNVIHIWRKPDGWTTLDIWGRIWASMESAFYYIDMRATRIRNLNNYIKDWASIGTYDAVNKSQCDSQFVSKREFNDLKEQLNRMKSLVKKSTRINK